MAHRGSVLEDNAVGTLHKAMGGSAPLRQSCSEGVNDLPCGALRRARHPRGWSGDSQGLVHSDPRQDKSRLQFGVRPCTVRCSRCQSDCRRPISTLSETLQLPMSLGLVAAEQADPNDRLRTLKEQSADRVQPHDAAMDTSDRLLTTQQLAEYLAVPVATLYAWRRGSTGVSGGKAHPLPLERCRPVGT